MLQASSDRVQPPCSYVARCGGCSLMHASVEAQHQLHLRFLTDALTKAGMPQGFELRHTPARASLGYRRRARLAYQVGSGGRRLGFRRERSRETLDVAQCLVLHETLQAALALVRVSLLPLLDGEGELSLALGAGGRAVLVIRTGAVQMPALYTACDREVSSGQWAGVALYAAGATKPATFGDPRELGESPDGERLEGGVGGFSQANAEVNALLVQRVVELVRPAAASVIELYAGHGNFSVALAGAASSYVAVEQDPEAVAALRRNLERRGLRAKIVEGDAQTHPVAAGQDVALLDPPRSGAPGLLTRLADKKVGRIVYVSCDPATLGRDVAEALSRGYELTWAEAFEMFPNTADLESVVALERV